MCLVTQQTVGLCKYMTSFLTKRKKEKKKAKHSYETGIRKTVKFNTHVVLEFLSVPIYSTYDSGLNKKIFY